MLMTVKGKRIQISVNTYFSRRVKNGTVSSKNRTPMENRAYIFFSIIP